MKTTRAPQLALRLDASAPDPADRWHHGTEIAYLGGSLRLQLDTAGKDALLEGAILHLPLPPQATPRQIQDRAEAWLRDAAKQHFFAILAQKSALVGRRTPQFKLSFAAHGSWVQVQDAETLRCNWRLIEQGPEVIELALTRAIAAMPQPEQELDLFAAFAA
jgi:predicted metal-dependent hydrolase